MHDLHRLQIEVKVLFYADDILVCLPGYNRSRLEDLRALLYVLNVFGYLLRLRVNYEKHWQR